MRTRRSLVAGLALAIFTLGAVACAPAIAPPIPNPCDIICGQPNPTTTAAPKPIPVNCTIFLHFPDQIGYGYAQGFYEPEIGNDTASWATWMANCRDDEFIPIKKIDQARNLPGQNPKVAVHLLEPHYMQLNPPNIFPQAMRGRYLALYINDRTLWNDAFVFGTWLRIGP